MNKRKLKSYRICGKVNTRGVRVTDKELIEELNKLYEGSLEGGVSVFAPTTSGCTVSSTGKHTWYLKDYCYYVCGSCKYPTTSHDGLKSATCTKGGYCTSCGATNLTSALGHSFSSSYEYCLRGCGATNPSYVPPVPNPSINSISFSSITATSFRVSVNASNAVEYDYLVSEAGSSSYIDTYYGTSSSSYTVTGNSGLKPNTQYKVGVNAYNKNGVKTYDYEYCTTDQAPQVAMPSPSFTPTVGGVDITWTNKTGASNFHYTLIKVGTTAEIKGNMTASYQSLSVTGLEKGVEYKAYAYFSAKSGYTDSDVAGSYWFTTKNYPQVVAPSLSCAPGLTSVTISWSPPTGANQIYLSIQNATQYQAEIVQQVSASSKSITVTGLKPSCKYNVYAYYTPLTGYLQSVTIGTSFTTSQKPTFYWSTTVQSGQPFVIKATDWRTLCNTINTWRGIKGYSNYSFTYVNSGDQITADIFNEASNALRTITSAGPNNVLRTEKCYAGYFTMFETAINNLTA